MCVIIREMFSHYMLNNTCVIIIREIREMFS